MKRIYCFIIAAFSTFAAFAQFTDDFSDGDFTSNPEWTGETSKFQVSAANELQLYDTTESGSACLVTQSQAINNASWEFLVKFDFNPSSANYANIYLAADQDTLDQDINGYYVMVGNTDDEVSLYRQDGSGKTKIIDGVDKRLDMSSVEVRIKVIRDDAGNWSLFSDTLGGINYYYEGSCFDDAYDTSQYSGVHCVFSSTRWDKMFFDDFNVYVDTISPEVISADLLTPASVQIEFSEYCDTITSLNPANYDITPDMGNPDEVTLSETSANIAVLHYATGEMDNSQYTLSVSNVADYFGNIMEETDIILQDDESPELTNISVLSDNELLITYSEPMESTTTLNTSNYAVDNGIGNPSNASFDAGDATKVWLEFTAAFENNTSYNLSYQNCEDLFGNVIVNADINFAYVVPGEFDVVINEIMADPTPSVGLPEEEYLEIYNTIDFPIDLGGWQLIIGSSSYDFPDISIPADEQMIISRESDSLLFAEYGIVTPIDGLTGYILPNAGAMVQLLDDEGDVIDEVSYTDEWYQDPDKDDGGWSIERIDPWNTCSGMYNWAASIHPDGGTPGATNSIFGQNQDTVPPEVTSTVLLLPTSVHVEFSEYCDTITSLNPANYVITPDMGNPDEVTLSETSETIVELHYDTGEMDNSQYTLSISNIADVCGNVMEETDIILQDDESPELTNISVLSDNELLITFSEPMESTTTLNTSNYEVDNGIGNPSNASFDGGDTTKVWLEFPTAFENYTSYNLSYQNCEDLYGNAITGGDIEFSYVLIEQYDIVINEIMADPTPVVGLPESEYLEIYNTLDVAVNLDGFQLEINSSTYNFGAVTLPADEEMIICSSSDSALFVSYGLVTAPDGMGVSVLLNAGATVKILDDSSNVVDEVSYTDEWYQDPDKDNGGWSIERIDPWNTCSGMYNWAASTHSDGGTPGATNSIFGQNQDTFAPELVSWELPSANEIKLTFSEAADTATSLNPANYYLAPDFGEPYFVTINEDDPRVVHLQYLSGLEENTLYTLTISNIADNCGNVMEDTEITFINYEASCFDVLITEIMADPSPPVFLPEAEYVELYNQSPYPINLADWKLVLGNSEYNLPAAEVPVDSYICLTKSDNISAFDDVPNVVAADNFPLLPNSSGELQLVSKEGNLIHFVNYSSEWYGDPTKDDGGWSLEMIDTDNPCGENDNWRASVSETGGTPGEENSVISNNPDSDVPDISRVIVQEPDTLLILFDETMHPSFVPDASEFEVDRGVGTAVYAARVDGRMNAVLVAFDEAFEHGTVYTLQVTDTVEDCVGNEITSTVEKEFALADSVEQGDVVINEILFNPPDGAEDYIELYNRSDKFIDLYDLRMASRDDSLRVDNLEVITGLGFLLFPGDYVVLSEDIDAVDKHYYCKYPEQLLQVEDLPSYTNSEGDVVLCIPNKEIIDEVVYNEDMHFKLLRSVKGVALERIDYDQPASDENNWHSAAEAVGFGTPTYQNSQYSSSETAESMFELSPESFSPDNDGYDDVLTISYNMDKPGYVLSISIFNAKGHPVRKLLDNELLAREGRFVWDGLNDDGMHPGSGIYIVLFDYFDLDGNRHQEKKTTVIAVKQ